MATRIGDILSYRAKTKKFQDEAKAQEAALDDFPTQASLFIEQVATTAKTLKPFAKDSLEVGETPDNNAFEYTPYENAISPGLNVGQQSFINRMAKDALGGAYAEDIDYVMDEDGKFVPKMLAGDAFSMMTYKSKPKTNMGFNIDTSLPAVPEINLNGIRAANKKIMEGQDEFTKPTFTGFIGGMFSPIYNAFAREYYANRGINYDAEILGGEENE
jgi:hypothetical protein